MSALLSRVVAALAVAAGAAVLFAPQALAIAGGLLLGFVLPGMALLGVLFRRRALTAVERTVLTPALSMGVLIVAGLAIHVLGLRIDRLAWTVATVGVTLAAVVATRLLPPRRVRATESAEPQVRPVGEKLVRIGGGENTVRLPLNGMAEANTVVMSIVPAVLEEDEQRAAAEEKARRRRLLRQFLPLVAVAAVLAGASWLSFTTSRATHDTVVTALSATPSGRVNAAGNRTVRVSASGLVASDGPYTISVTGPSGTATLRRTVSVIGDGTWSDALSMPGAQRMTVSLYRFGDTTAYRTLYISAVD
ncbi:hypothetical protein [Actinoplanes auranticolor]|uniref:DUF1616 domain-containing protein n=1 Tax=Actinoplanes auranticolor TaxID=47988 RepID=A0A919SWE5_9ACTN|nr:hypothetical protein [Actinoplanes auranticolor]GIM80085.1 hypothetical protein Aau02nite_88940 [Actinoplanes auranticolor]